MQVVMMLAQSFGNSHPKTWVDVAYGAICPVCILLAIVAFGYFNSRSGGKGIEIEISTEAPKAKKKIADPLAD